MLDARACSPGAQAFQAARCLAPRSALQQACLALTGQEGYLLAGTHAVHGTDAPLIDPDQPERAQEAQSCGADPALAAFGLGLSRVAARPATALSPELAQVFVALRLGLLARILDLSYRHLEPRQAFGQRLLHQPLIKAQFSKSGAFVSQVQEELEQGGEIATTRLHDQIDQHGQQAAKLMGGHGFRAGEVNGLEYLSGLLRATLTPVAERG
ncbi:hypothetical protein [Phaeobacter sp. HF9A]|uniref:hypothetical protein n=1 Tax=Phaeobacter sp. HF9A TaxID=2721561 RepID=UPI00142FBF26|nr:hypothetical protein [Phaeobacter sp. HF9A]NIZ12590.1 hypothetical protein [Phaeobacter sp. HF9A]